MRSGALAVFIASGLTAVTVFMSMPAAASPAIDQLQVGQLLPRFNLIRPGVHRYARYLVVGDQRTLIDLWARTVSFEQTGKQRILHIHQRWDAADKSYVAIFDQTFEAGTFRPLSQTRILTRDGVTKTSIMKIDGAKVDTTNDGALDAGKTLHVSFPMSFYNFHTDMELLQALPLAKGYAASIPFYDVGLDPPARYTYSVAGDDIMPGPDGSPISCWIVEFRETPAAAPIRFWLAKAGQTLLREEGSGPQGHLIKTLLNAEAGDGPRRCSANSAPPSAKVETC